MEDVELVIGDQVYFYSIKLDLLIEGIVEGFDQDNRRRVKILTKEGDYSARHVVSWAYVFTNLDRATEFLDETRGNRLHSGCRVSIRGSLTDQEFQVTAVYSDRARVSLVNPLREPVGTFSFYEVQYISDEPLFNKDEFSDGDSVSWIDGDDVYSGTISSRKKSTAEIIDIKKLYPVDYHKNIPYYKLYKNDSLDEEPILQTIIGDKLDMEGN